MSNESNERTRLITGTNNARNIARHEDLDYIIKGILCGTTTIGLYIFFVIFAASKSHDAMMGVATLGGVASAFALMILIGCLYALYKDIKDYCEKRGRAPAELENRGTPRLVNGLGNDRVIAVQPMPESNFVMHFKNPVFTLGALSGVANSGDTVQASAKETEDNELSVAYLEEQVRQDGAADVPASQEGIVEAVTAAKIC